MRKNDPKVKSQRLQAVVARGVLALALASLLIAPVAVRAELKATSLAYSWDIAMSRFEWGHVTIEWDGSWIPLLQEVYFDHLDRPPEPHEPQVCADPTKRTRYAGWIEYGLPYLDSEPVGARGFQGSRKWTLVDCDLNGDGNWDDDDLLVGPWVLDEGAQVLAECSAGGTNCNILHQDYERQCPSETDEHCDNDLSTMLLISIDTDCDGEVDGDAAHFLDAEGICVYSEALTPDYEAGEIFWTFPLPIRITDADGAKTLMLYPDPTAIDLASFHAEPQGRDVLVSWETAAEIDNVGFNVYRSMAGDERVRLNDWLIPSQNPGSTVGSSYQFLDRSAEPDTTYEYWLEDIDTAGAAAMNGPLAVQTPRSRFLPCRPRPAPMPQSQ